MALTPKQQAFVEHYLQCWNASEAARRAGYNGRANTVGPRLLSNVVIAQAIKERLAELKMSADEVLVRLTEQARGDMSEFIRFEDGVKMPFSDWKAAYDKGLFRLVKKFKYDAQGRPEIELYDAQAALVQMGKAHGLFVDKQEISGAVTLDLGEAVDRALEQVYGNHKDG